MTIKLFQKIKARLKSHYHLLQQILITCCIQTTFSEAIFAALLTERNLTLKLLSQSILVASDVTLHPAIVTIYVILLLGSG